MNICKACQDIAFTFGDWALLTGMVLVLVIMVAAVEWLGRRR